jgi:hypothetical protein
VIPLPVLQRFRSELNCLGNGLAEDREDRRHIPLQSVRLGDNLFDELGFCCDGEIQALHSDSATDQCRSVDSRMESIAGSEGGV